MLFTKTNVNQQNVMSLKNQKDMSKTMHIQVIPTNKGIIFM